MLFRMLATSCSSGPISNVAASEKEPYDILWDAFTSKTSVNFLMSESTRPDIALRKDSQDVLLFLTDREKNF